MRNPVTDGQLQDETPPLTERLLAAFVGMGILYIARHLGMYPWHGIRWGLDGLTVMSTVCVWFPEIVGDWASSANFMSSEIPAAGVRITGWVILLFLAVGLGTTWFIVR